MTLAGLRCVRRGKTLHVVAGRGKHPGEAWPGQAALGTVGQDKASTEVCPGVVWPCEAEQDAVRQGKHLVLAGRSLAVSAGAGLGAA